MSRVPCAPGFHAQVFLVLPVVDQHASLPYCPLDVGVPTVHRSVPVPSAWKYFFLALNHFISFISASSLLILSNIYIFFAFIFTF